VRSFQSGWNRALNGIRMLATGYAAALWLPAPVRPLGHHGILFHRPNTKNFPGAFLNDLRGVQPPGWKKAADRLPAAG